MSKEQITLTTNELKRAMVMDKWIAGHISESDVVRVLGISTRQAYRLKAKYRQGGAQALAHRNRGQKPSHALADELKQRVQQLYRERYTGCNCTHYAELLDEHEGIQLSVSSVRRILIKGGLHSPRARRRKTAHRPRARKPQAGMLWQIDASPYAWLEDRGPQLTLHGIIDDATGEVLAAVFRPTETLEGYVTVMIEALRHKGVPLALYSDRHTIFRSPKEELTLEQELAGETKPLSTFGKALADLGIEHVKALTPQAKGRIERLWQTFQDRLVIELRLLNVCTEEEANRVLPNLLRKHNQRFAVVPENTGSAYRPLSDARQLEYIFARREYRRISNGQTFSWDGKCYMPKPCYGLPRWEAKEIVEVRVTMDGQVFLWHQGRAWSCVEAHAPSRSSNPPKKRAEPAPPRKPAANHPWRNAFSSKQLQRNTASG